ncbi:hypothetical protein BJ170DRAFT_610528 [Xylariales sp. AK1849]|nr:hypothetical protein BJ170DRAFT_610528 [Xylariales sp. AK1849]
MGFIPLADIGTLEPPLKPNLGSWTSDELRSTGLGVGTERDLTAASRRGSDHGPHLQSSSAGGRRSFSCDQARNPCASLVNDFGFRMVPQVGVNKLVTGMTIDTLRRHLQFRICQLVSLSKLRRSMASFFPLSDSGLPDKLQAPHASRQAGTVDTQMNGKGWLDGLIRKCKMRRLIASPHAMRITNVFWSRATYTRLETNFSRLNVEIPQYHAM